MNWVSSRIKKWKTNPSSFSLRVFRMFFLMLMQCHDLSRCKIFLLAINHTECVFHLEHRIFRIILGVYWGKMGIREGGIMYGAERKNSGKDSWNWVWGIYGIMWKPRAVDTSWNL